MPSSPLAWRVSPGSRRVSLAAECARVVDALVAAAGGFVDPAGRARWAIVPRAHATVHHAGRPCA